MNEAAEKVGFFELAVEEKLFASESRLKFHLNFVFDGIDLKGKSVLDIGGGKGLYSFYAAHKGASKVVCLEPESDGSSSNVVTKFNELKVKLGYENVELRQLMLQDLGAKEKFDIILMHNSINHLDEPACVDLLENEESQKKYLKIFEQIYALTNPGGKVIACDCSNHNFFHLLNIRNPFVPKIEWEKHQSPNIWAQLMGFAGFKNPKITWSSINRLGKVGKVLISNKVGSYFTKSYFCLHMEK
ncbi:class I SAM-dependent methyltransferase [Litoribacter ruber]|uniref:class I SAM-dependent methyltransferase n=1 Tax=Litoribacter ruber TaxID=702568 RepID=UPI001BDA02D5|nr:methyltransferase domain-containing protein [Litoribacter ruber]MBT0809691.1 class I SAM-dependent methyltransferase [Litoribacter ruber]